MTNRNGAARTLNDFARTNAASGLAIATRIESAGSAEDRLVVDQRADRTIIVVADGAGGLSGGGAAAELICTEAIECFKKADTDAIDWSRWLVAADRQTRQLGLGQSTAVIVEVQESETGCRVRGASVGDSIAWMLDAADRGGLLRHDLTELQARKPLMGSGIAVPVRFGPEPLFGRLLVATDGLWKYTTRDAIASACSAASLKDAVATLISSVRLPSGTLQDDVAIAICERSIAP